MFAALTLTMMLGSALAGPSQDTIRFLEGVVVGLEVQIGNVTECTKDLEIGLSDFQNAVADIEFGLRNINLDRLEKGITEFGAGLNIVSDAMRACGLNSLADDIAAIAADIQAGPDGVFKFIVGEAIKIFANEKELTTDFDNLISGFRTGNYFEAGRAVGDILGILLEEKTGRAPYTASINGLKRLNIRGKW